MQESIQAAMTWCAARANRARHRARLFDQKHDIHLHVPEGATPKDGPSAGIGMCTAHRLGADQDPGALAMSR
jgi:ATP-dependent Lon protease